MTLHRRVYAAGAGALLLVTLYLFGAMQTPSSPTALHPQTYSNVGAASAIAHETLGVSLLPSVLT